MLRDGRLRSGFTWLVSGSVLYSACQWGIVWVLAQAGSTEQLGEYALGMAITGPIMVFSNFQLRALIASDLKENYAFGQYLSFRFASLGAALLAIAIAAAVAGRTPAATRMILLVGFAQAVEFVSDSYYGVMQREERLDRMAKSLLIKGPLALAALAVTMYLTGSALYAIGALTLGRLSVLLLWDSRLGFASRPPGAFLRWNWGKVRGLLRLSLPLGVISMLVSVNTNVPRYFLEALRGSSALGIFAAIASLLNAGTLVVSAMGQSMFVPVAQACSGGDVARFRTFLMQAVVLGAALGTVAVSIALLFGREVLAILFGGQYSAHTRLLVILMVAGTASFIASGLGYFLTAAGRLRAQVPQMAASVATAAGVSAWLVPRYGAEGAAAAVGIAALVQLTGALLILRRVDRTLRAQPAPAVELACSVQGAAR